MNFLRVGLLLTLALPAATAAGEPMVIELRTMPGLMKYDQNVLRVKPGQDVEIRLKNDDQLPHNLVVLDRAGVFMEVAQAAWELGEKGAVRQWIPDDPRVLAHTGLVDPGKAGVVKFRAPEGQTELDFVCTFPGHAMIMNGRLVVSEAPPPGLSELTCMIYRGAWDRLPDFSTLPPAAKVAVDEVNDNLITVKVTELRDEFGLVFNGLLEAPADGDYVFWLGSDDGSRLLIDEQEVLRNDGIHAHGEKRKRVALTAGRHRVRVEYFEQAGEESLTLAWRGPGFERTWLSKEQQSAGEELPEIVLGPTDGRPVVYRGFLSPNGGSRRLIAVGTPEQVNYAFDQDQLRLAMVWKGAFLDAGRHWTGRGAGDIAPLGFAVVERPSGEEWARLGEPTASWPEPDELGRARHSRFLGYRLEGDGSPIFQYRVHGVTIDDALRPAGNLAEASDRLVRTISLESNEPLSDFHFRLATGAEVRMESPGEWRLGGSLLARVEGGGEPVLRGGQLLVPVVFDHGRARVVVTYRWL